MYATVDVRLAKFLIDDFEQLYPGIKIEFTTIDTAGLDARFAQESAQGGHSADVLWSAAMDRQMSCVAQGCALTYRSPESASLPKWARWRDQVYATTYEPIVVVYNRRLVRSDERFERARIGQSIDGHVDVPLGLLIQCHKAIERGVVRRIQDFDISASHRLDL